MNRSGACCRDPNKRNLLAGARLRPAMRLPAAPGLAPALALALAATLALAGCAASDRPGPTATTAASSTTAPTSDPPADGWLGYDLRQCETPAWAASRPTGDAQQVRDGWVRQARDHYTALGATIADGRVTDDGGAYAAVCGGPTGQRVHLRVTAGKAPLEKDGWTLDTPSWFLYVFTQCEQPSWSPEPPTHGDAQQAWVDQAREHYEAKGVRILDGASSFTQDDTPPECGRPSNFRVHLQLAPAEDPALLVQDGWERDRQGP